MASESGTGNVRGVPDPPQTIPTFLYLLLTPCQTVIPFSSHSKWPAGPLTSISSPTTSSAKQLRKREHRRQYVASRFCLESSGW